MGFFNRLFQSDPSKDLARAEKLLARGDAAEALRLVERAIQQGAGDDAVALASRAREVLVEAALSNAAHAEESEYWEDAAEWLERVLHHVDGARRDEFVGRIAEFRRREQQANLPDLPAALTEEDFAGHNALDESASPPSDDLFEFYLDTLREDVAQHFEHLPQSFRHAVVQINEGEFGAALEVLEELADSLRHDPVLHLERGRARLAHGQFEAAATDLELAWESLGDEPLDRAGHFSIPALWGEAQLAQEQSSSVVERLRELADPRGMDLETIKVFAQALLLEEDFDEAAKLLATAWNHHPKVLDLPLLLTTALRRLDRPAEAITILESVVAPSCGPGGCNVGAPHLPSMITLINLHLESGDPERARELLELLTGLRGGQLGREDLLMMARYYDRVGDEESAHKLRQRAEQAASAPTAQDAPTPSLGGQRAAL